MPYDVSLIDSSRPEMVSIDITSRCNLRCAHCYNNSGTGADDMDDAALLDAARQIRLLRPFNVCLCGGEPLCRAAHMEVIDILRPDVGRVCMVSNGLQITREKARELVTHGVDAVQISLDGAFAWQHDTLRGAAGSFERAVNAIRLLKEAGIGHVSVAMLPNKLNLHTMDEYARLCVSLGVGLMRTMPFIPSGRGLTVGRGLMLDEREYFAFCQNLRKLRNLYGEQLRVEWTDPLSHMRAMSERADKGTRNMDMEIRANGDIAVSTYLPIIVGNCRRHSLWEYWMSGYDRIWQNERVKAFAGRILGVYDLESFEPKPYSGENICFDIWEERNEISHQP